jgi:ABC-type transporter Mla subunit MlaD
MQIRQNEITTGLLVLVTFGIFITILVIIGMPGLIKPLNTYRIYFDNAEGIRPGAPVLLAGREIGKVTSLKSPIPLAKRPNGHSDYEVSIDVQVSRNAEIYRNATVRLTQQSLMGQEVIDFVHGDESAGLAENHTEFTGQRVPDISESVADNMTRLTGPDSDLAHTLQNLKRLTEPDSELSLSIANFEHLTGPDADLSLTIKNAKIFMETLNQSQVPQVIKNTEQLTDTLKREPWRLIWPSTKSYVGDPKVDSQVPVKKPR